MERSSDYDPSILAQHYSPDELYGHFVLTRGKTTAPESWVQLELSDWTLRHERSLPVVRLVDQAGAGVGWLLGHAIDLAKRALVTEPCQVPSTSEPDFEVRFERWLYAHGGRFAAILVEPSPRAYVDAFGSLPVFFEPPAHRVSSSPFLLVDPGSIVPDSSLVSIVDPYETGQYYPFDETCHRDARRLLPSHVLDMDVFAQRRIWPSGPLPPTSPEDAVEITASLLEATIEALARTGRTVLGLTAGGDSRMLLACARQVAEEIDLYTVAFDDVTGKTDVATASRMAREVGVEWRRVPWVESSDEDVRLWFYRTGAVVGELRGRRSVRTENQLAAGGRPVRIAGVGVELSRGYAWNRGLLPGEVPDTPTKVLTGEDLLARLVLRRHPAVAAAGDRWLKSIPGLDALDTIDLCYLECRDGGWAGPITLGHPDAFVTTIFPLANRAFLEAVFGLPHDYRAADRLRRDVIASRWPELGALPINHVPFRVGLEAKARRAIQLPRRVGRRAERLLRTRS